MKKIIVIFAFVPMFIACRNHVDSATENAATTTTPTKPVVVQKEVHYVNTDANPAQPAQKRGMSKAAKGTLIGAGSGALVGAVVSKQKGKGAIIGGVAGGAAGYLIGRSKDKKDGRVRN